MISKLNTVKDFEVPEFIIIMPITKLPNWQKFEKKIYYEFKWVYKKKLAKKSQKFDNFCQFLKIGNANFLFFIITINLLRTKINLY